MNQIYLDNAATTSVRPEVVEEMVKILTNDFGNPSSTYAVGRHTKALIESARKAIAKQFGVTSGEIIFTSCGTEGNNWIIRSRSEEHTSELQSRPHLVCRLLL